MRRVEERLVVFESEVHLVRSDPAVLSGSKSCLGGGAAKNKNLS